MREIKFRGYNEESKKWIYGYYVKFDDLHFIIPKNSKLSEFPTDSDMVVVPESIGQFTGLKDKNEIEIYEGDIVDWPNYEGRLLYFVEFLNGRFGLNLSRDGFGLDLEISKKCEVIGNKFEHNHLLKK